MPNINTMLPEVGCKYGAPMGRRNQRSGEPEMLYLQPLKMVDGDYDEGGAYWGGWTAEGGVFCAFSDGPDSKNDDPIRIFVRARSHDAAKEIVLDTIGESEEDGWKFQYLDVRGNPVRM